MRRSSAVGSMCLYTSTVYTITCTLARLGSSHGDYFVNILKFNHCHHSLVHATFVRTFRNLCIHSFCSLPLSQTISTPSGFAPHKLVIFCFDQHPSFTHPSTFRSHSSTSLHPSAFTFKHRFVVSGSFRSLPCANTHYNFPANPNFHSAYLSRILSINIISNEANFCRTLHRMLLTQWWNADIMSGCRCCYT